MLVSISISTKILFAKQLNIFQQMLLLTNIHGKASNHSHYGASASLLVDMHKYLMF